MAATATTAATTKLIQFRSICLPSATVGSVSVKCFSSSSSNPDHNEDSPQTNSFPPPLPPPPPPTPTPKSPSLYSSLFSDVKATLKQQQGNLQSQPSRISRPSFNFSNKEEIERNLSEFRRRSAVPPPPSDGSFTQPNKQLSFAEIYQRNEASTGEDSSSASSKSVGRSALKSISESLKFLRTKTGNNASERFAKNKDSMSLSRFRESLKMKPGDLSGRDSTNLIGGSDNLPMSVFGKEMEEGDKASGDADTGGEYVRPYNHKDMGEKLKSLRPDRKGDWFSLQELNNRLMKLRQIDKAEADPSSGIYGTLRGSLIQINKADKQMKQMPNLDILRHLGRTPSFMMLPPQEQLIAKYFHPDNMSASEKLKLDLMKVRDEFKMSESDCGSARVQVAQLTTKIKHLASVLHKKDKHSKKGLLGMVQKRKTLLKYLRRTDWESYSFVLSKLGLRDNPDYKK